MKCVITFFYEEERTVILELNKAPRDHHETDNIAFGVIRSWFENQKITIPDFVRNVTIKAGELTCEVDKLVLIDINDFDRKYNRSGN